MAISNSGIINVNPGTSLTMVNDTYNGNNFVQLNGSSTANATLTINGGTTSFSGLAGIGLNTGFTSTIAINGNGTFDNHTFVSGGGLIGQNTLTIFNSGTITVGGNVFITLDPGPGGLTNTGTLQATIGTLLFAGGSYTNNGGTITAQLGGTVVLSDGAVITGGKYATGTNGGQVQTNVLSAVQVSNGTITNVGMTVVGTSSLTIGGTITNNGSLNVGASTGTARLLVGNASVTLNGTGTTTLSTGTGTAVIDGNGGTLNIGSQQLIHGDGTIGTGALGINNAGTISADDLILTINIGSLGMTNTGVLQNVTGGHLIINNVGGAGGGVINNAGGLIDAFGNSLSVDLNNGVVVKGGTINHATGSRKGVNVLSTSATLANLMNNGVVSLTNGTLTLVGTINDSDLGTIVDGADLEPATLTVGSGSVSLVGHGELAVGLNAVVTGSPGGMLTNGPQHVIDGSGTLGNNAIGLINQGTVIPFNGSTFTVNPGIGNLVNSGTIQSSTSLAPETGTLALSFNVGTCTNSGTILAASGGLITLSAGTLDSSSGTIIVTGAGAGTVTAVGTLVNNSGLLIAPGIKLDGQFTNLFTTLGPAVTGTSLVGAGSFTNGDATHPFASTRVFPLRVGTFTANSGTTSFAAGGGTLGTGSISSLTMAPGARLDVANHDLIIDYASTSPIATVASLVASGYAGGAWNGPGIDSIIAAAIDGDPLVTHKVGLGYADASMIGSPATFSGQSIDSTASLIRYTYVGDANIDGHVNALDFNAVASNFGGAAKIWPQGDFNYDGQVNTADFTALATNFNVVPLSGPALGVLVPEAALTTFPLLLLLSRRRRKQ
jgi:hypothetical protein